MLGKDAGEMGEAVIFLITHDGTVDSIHSHPTLNGVISELAMRAVQDSQPVWAI